MANTNEEFFIRLAELFDSRRSRGHGSVYLVQKRLAYDESKSSASSPAKQEGDTLADLETPAEPLPVLIRATDGSSSSGGKDSTTKSKGGVKKSGKGGKSGGKVKLSTVVQPSDLESFYTRYAEVCKAGMSSLKKRDRSAKKKGKKKK